MIEAHLNKISQASSIVQLSSVKVEFSEEGELQSSSGGNAPSIAGNQSQNFNSYSQNEYKSQASVKKPFQTPKKSGGNVGDPSHIMCA